MATSIAGNLDYTEISNTSLDTQLNLAEAPKMSRKDDYLEVTVSNSNATINTAAVVAPAVFATKSRIIIIPEEYFGSLDSDIAPRVVSPVVPTFIIIEGRTSAQMLILQNALFKDNPKVGDQFELLVENRSFQPATIRTGTQNGNAISIGVTGVTKIIVTVTNITSGSEDVSLSDSPAWGGIGSSYVAPYFSYADGQQLQSAANPSGFPTNFQFGMDPMIPTSYFINNLNTLMPFSYNLGLNLRDGTLSQSVTGPLPTPAELLNGLSGVVAGVPVILQFYTNINNHPVLDPAAPADISGGFNWDPTTLSSAWTVQPAGSRIDVNNDAASTESLSTMGVHFTYLMVLKITPAGTNPLWTGSTGIINWIPVMT